MQSFTLKFSSRKREMHPKMNMLAEAALSPFLSTYCTYIFFHMKSHWEETEDKLILQRFTYMIQLINAGSYEPSNVMEIKDKVGWVKRWSGNPIVTTELLILSHNATPIACLSVEEASGPCNHCVSWRIC